MDPLDKLLAILMLRMVSAVREESSEEKEHKREKQWVGIMKVDVQIEGRKKEWKVEPYNNRPR